MFKIIIAFATMVMISVGVNARENVSIAGSSTVLPFATVIAEQVGKKPSLKTPVVESGGSSVGKKGVCDGTGLNYIDIGNASSRMKIKELDYCDKNNVTVTEIKVGYDGIVLANSKKGTQLNLGLIAQDEIEVEKEHGYGDTSENMLVSHVNEDGNYGMQYSKLVPILINAVKELSAKNTALEARIAALEGS